MEIMYKNLTKYHLKDNTISLPLVKTNLTTFSGITLAICHWNKRFFTCCPVAVFSEEVERKKKENL